MKELIVPAYIKEHMHKVALYAYKSAKHMYIVERWLEDNNIDVDKFRDGCGCSIEELEYGNDITDEICNRLETGEI